MTDILIYTGIAFAFLAVGNIVGRFQQKKKSEKRMIALQLRCDELKSQLDDYGLRLRQFENIKEAEDKSDAEMAHDIYN